VAAAADIIRVSQPHKLPKILGRNGHILQPQMQLSITTTFLARALSSIFMLLLQPFVSLTPNDCSRSLPVISDSCNCS